MKVYLIKASAGSSFSKYKKMTGGPPQNIFSAAAATPDGIAIEMADETVGMKTKFRSDADVIAIFMSTPDALRAYEIANKFKKKGRVVVLAGLHTAFNQKEALEHADAIMVGEVEGIWEQLLTDISAGNLQPKYQRATPLDLAELKPYPTNFIPMRHYNYTWSVVVSRGCPFGCAFCLVHKFTNKYRLRPIENIVEEIRNCPVEWIELHSDNLTANRKYALELFRALKPLKKKFFAETTILIGKDDELLEAAKETGVKAMLFGIETLSKEALKDQGKGFVKPEDIKQHVKNIQSHGIMVMSDFLFGFDALDNDIFEDTVEFIKDIGFNEVYPHLLIPFPGSKTFDDLEKEGRILTKDWSQYDGTHAVFKPKQMSPKELENGTYWVWQQSEKIKKKSEVNMMIDSTDKTSQTSVKNMGIPSSMPWKSMLALGIILAGLLLDIYWIWGIFFIIWAVNDIRNGWTYLLDVVQRSVNPMLYWIIVGMWIFMGIWTLFLAPVAYWQTAGFVSKGPRILLEGKSKETSGTRNTVIGAAFAESITKINDAPSTNEPEKSKAGHATDASRSEMRGAAPQEHLVRSERFGIVISVPKEWKVSRESDAESETIEVTAPGDQAYMSIICVDMKVATALEEFVSYMQYQLKQEMPFIDTDHHKRIPDTKAIAVTGTDSELLEYPGKYDGYDIKTLVRYVVQDKLGYIVIGTFESSDRGMQEIIRAAVDSIVIDKFGGDLDAK